jgi:hypothetical protein
MTLIGRMGKWWPLPIIIPLLVLLGALAAVFAGLYFSFPDDRAAHRLCDQTVAALLHSKDQVEVIRAGIIVYEVGCGISRRWEAEQPK